MRARYADPAVPVRDPVTFQYPALAEDGTFVVPDNTFWIRRKRDGSIIVVAETVPAAADTAPAPLTTR